MPDVQKDLLAHVRLTKEAREKIKLAIEYVEAGKIRQAQKLQKEAAELLEKLEEIEARYNG